VSGTELKWAKLRILHSKPRENLKSVAGDNGNNTCESVVCHFYRLVAVLACHAFKFQYKLSNSAQYSEFYVKTTEMHLNFDL
jgi:hypothetical protein